MLPQWTVPTNYNLGTIQESINASIDLPLQSNIGIISKLISGSLPRGLRLENNKILGSPFEVKNTTVSTFVIRASNEHGISDRTFKITVEGADSPIWITPQGSLPVGANNTFFILDNTLIDFQLLATDKDLPAGDVLEYFVEENAGELPPGISLTRDGRLVGVVEPIISLEVNAGDGSYDTVLYDTDPYDFGFGNDFDGRIPKKLNRNYEFEVSVADNNTIVKRRFKIFVVSDDFVRSDNTIMKAANGVFTADSTYLRTPLWLTPSNLGIRRANNYLTVDLEVLNTNTLDGEINYFIEPLNDDGSVSTLPPNLTLDTANGRIAGIIPYQPAVTKEYKFTVNAIRIGDTLGLITVFGIFLEDVVAGKRVIKLAKLPTTIIDGVTDLQRLAKQQIVIGENYYNIESVDSTNADYDLIFLTTELKPISFVDSLILSKNANVGNDYFFVDTITENSKLFYKDKSLSLSNFENYTVDELYPYIEFNISSTDPITLSDELPGDLVTTLTSVLSYNNRSAYITVINSNNINIIIPATAENRNQFYIKSLLKSNDEISIKEVNQFDRVSINETLVAPLFTGRKIDLGIVAKSSFTKRFVRSTFEIVEKAKTFTIKILGEVDSTVSWISDSDLGIIKANRISNLFVKAKTTVIDSLIKYTLISGKLPNGLELKDNGEIVGKVPIYATETALGLTFFDSGNTTFDAGTTTFDRKFTFTVNARDRFGYSSINRTFTLKIDDADNLNYSNLYSKPFLKRSQKEQFLTLIGDAKVIDPKLIYRPSDENFGVQKDLKTLIFAGIETKSISDFVKATVTNHKRKRFLIGDIKTAIAKTPGTNNIVYEVVYIDLIDPADPKRGKTKKFINKTSSNKITVDSLRYETLDTSLPYDNPWRFRPNGNTLTADSAVIDTSRANNSKLFISNIDNMKDQIRTIGNESRDFLPLWMRTPQDDNLTELGYVLAIPLIYTMPGGSKVVQQNMINNGYDFKFINYEIDRYIVDLTLNSQNEEYIIFANYFYNI